MKVAKAALAFLLSALPASAATRDVLVRSPGGAVALRVALDEDGRLVYAITQSGWPVIETLAARHPRRRRRPGPGRDARPRGALRARRALSLAGRPRDGAEPLQRRAGGARHTRPRARPGPSRCGSSTTRRPSASSCRAAGAASPTRPVPSGLPAGSTVWYHGARDHYEGIHARKELGEVPADDWAAPPLTIRLPGRRRLRRDHRGRALRLRGHDAAGRRPGRLRTSASGTRSRRAIPTRCATGRRTRSGWPSPRSIVGPITTPWRVVLVGKDLNALVNSDAIPSLNPPPDPRLFPQGMRTPWLRPGSCGLALPRRSVDRERSRRDGRAARPARLPDDPGVLAAGGRAGLRAPGRRGPVAAVLRRPAP